VSENATVEFLNKNLVATMWACDYDFHSTFRKSGAKNPHSTFRKSGAKIHIPLSNVHRYPKNGILKHRS